MNLIKWMYDEKRNGKHYIIMVYYSLDKIFFNNYMTNIKIYELVE